MISKKITIFIVACAYSTVMFCIDNPHFYRATYFWQEPRFEEPWLTTFDIYLGGGSSRTSRNQHGQKTTLLNIYGPQNMHDLGVGVPNLDPANPIDKILINLAATPSAPGFAQLQLDGRFQIIESMLYAYQNFTNGFFVEGHLPVRRLRINHVSFFKDLSPVLGDPNRNTPEWTTFLENFPAILKRYDYVFGSFERTGIGDLTLLGGWTCNYEETKKLDFIDVTGKIGVLFPTGAQRSLTQVISLPQGYNGHWGIPVLFDASLGFWEWVTVGMHISGLFFLKKSSTLRMKTALAQNGFFNLALGKAQVDQGTIWDFSGYFKADHVLKGLSFLLGYTFTMQEADCIEPSNSSLFSTAIVNSGQTHKAWNMHTLHFMAEWDFAKRREDIGPRLGFFYNLIVGGKRCFNTAVKTSYVGIDISWIY